MLSECYQYVVVLQSVIEHCKAYNYNCRWCVTDVQMANV